MKDFWESKHAEKDIRYVTGTGKELADALKVQGLFQSAEQMLNIGVGLGRWEKFCKEQGKKISSHDIATTARMSVSGIVDQFYETPAGFPDASFDLITCLLVFQHVEDATLAHIMNHSIRALRPGGVFAFQSPWFFDNKDHAITDMRAALENGAVCRPISAIDECVRQCGGRVVLAEHTLDFPQYNSVWIVYHAKKEAL